MRLLLREAELSGLELVDQHLLLGRVALAFISCE